MLTCRVVVVCPQPRHEFTVTVDPDGGDLAGQACEIVFSLLNIGRGGIGDLAGLGYAQQAETVRAWYAHHAGVTLEVTSPDGAVARLACDWIGCAHPADGPASTAPE